MLEQILIESAKTIGEQCLKKVAETAPTKNPSSSNVKKEAIQLQATKSPQPVEELRENIQQNHSVSLLNAYGRNKRLGVMVISAVIGLIICLLILTLCRENLSGEVIGIISTISGIFGACLKDAYSFEFGSSRGSREKDERISATIMERLKS